MWISGRIAQGNRKILRAEHYMDYKTKWKKSFHPYENIIRPQAYVDEYLGKYSKHSRPVQ